MGASTGAVVLGTAGQATGGPLRDLALFAPRGAGADDFPVNKGARVARITPELVGPDWRLELQAPGGEVVALTATICSRCPSTPMSCRSPAWRGGARCRRGRACGSPIWPSVPGSPMPAPCGSSRLQPAGAFKQTTLGHAQIHAEAGLLALKVAGADLTRSRLPGPRDRPRAARRRALHQVGRPHGVRVSEHPAKAPAARRGLIGAPLGAGPLHLLGHVALNAVVAWASDHVSVRSSRREPWNLNLWLLGAAVLPRRRDPARVLGPQRRRVAPAGGPPRPAGAGAQLRARPARDRRRAPAGVRAAHLRRAPQNFERALGYPRRTTWPAARGGRAARGGERCAYLVQWLRAGRVTPDRPDAAGEGGSVPYDRHVARGGIDTHAIRLLQTVGQRRRMCGRA